MAKRKFFIKQGNTKPDLVALLRRGDGTYPTLAGATIKFTMRSRRGGDRKVYANAIPNDEQHMARYQWAPLDTDTPDIYDAEFVVIYAGGAEETFPTNGYITVEVTTGL